MSNLVSKRSLQEAASILQEELLEKQAVYMSVHDEIRRLQSKLNAAEVERDALAVVAAERESIQILFQQVLDMCKERTHKLVARCTKTENVQHGINHKSFLPMLTHVLLSREPNDPSAIHLQEAALQDYKVVDAFPSPAGPV